MKKQNKILLIITFLISGVVFLEIKETEEKRELIKNFCDNIKIGEKINPKKEINNIKIYGDGDGEDNIFYYTARTSFDSFMCMVNMKNYIVVEKIFYE